MTRWLSTTTPFPTAEGFVNNTGRATPREGAAEIAGFSAYQGEGGGRFGGEEPAKEEWGPCAVGGQREQEAQEVKRSSEGRTAVMGLQLAFSGPLSMGLTALTKRWSNLSALISSGPLLKGEWEGKKNKSAFLNFVYQVCRHTSEPTNTCTFTLWVLWNLPFHREYSSILLCTLAFNLYKRMHYHGDCGLQSLAFFLFRVFFPIFTLYSITKVYMV